MCSQSMPLLAMLSVAPEPTLPTPHEEGFDTEQEVFLWVCSIRGLTVPEFWKCLYVLPECNPKWNRNAFWHLSEEAVLELDPSRPQSPRWHLAKFSPNSWSTELWAKYNGCFNPLEKKKKKNELSKFWFYSKISNGPSWLRTVYWLHSLNVWYRPSQNSRDVLNLSSGFLIK